MNRSKGLLGAALLALALEPRAALAQALVNPATEKKIDALLAQMTLEEKVGQLNQYSNPFGDLTGPPPSQGYQKAVYDQVRQGLVGSMINVNGAEATRNAVVGYPPRQFKASIRSELAFVIVAVPKFITPPPRSVAVLLEKLTLVALSVPAL